MFKKIVKRTLFVLFSLIDAYSLYATIGYIFLGSKAPVLYSGTTSYFLGMYIMSITFGLIFLILTTILTILFVKFKRKQKELKRAQQFWVPLAK